MMKTVLSVSIKDHCYRQIRGYSMTRNTVDKNCCYILYAARIEQLLLLCPECTTRGRWARARACTSSIHIEYHLLLQHLTIILILTAIRLSRFPFTSVLSDMVPFGACYYSEIIFTEAYQRFPYVPAVFSVNTSDLSVMLFSSQLFNPVPF